ncbi:MAG: type II toxin-antitoxin system YoeB family toxin [Sphingomonadaceae bacterium]
MNPPCGLTAGQTGGIAVMPFSEGADRLANPTGAKPGSDPAGLTPGLGLGLKRTLLHYNRTALEALRSNLSGWWSLRIDQEVRWVYRVDEEGVTIFSCLDYY